MKNVAKCDTWCELQNPVNHRVFERKLRPRDPPEGTPAWALEAHQRPVTRPRAESGPPSRKGTRRAEDRGRRPRWDRQVVGYSACRPRPVLARALTDPTTIRPSPWHPCRATHSDRYPRSGGATR